MLVSYTGGKFSPDGVYTGGHIFPEIEVTLTSKFATGVTDTGKNFAAVVIDIGGQQSQQIELYVKKSIYYYKKTATQQCLYFFTI